jgi:hypothetical protein
MIICCANCHIGVEQDRIALQDEKIDGLITKLNEVEQNHASQQGTFVAEVDGLKKMIDLYKRFGEEATAKTEELESTLKIVREKNATTLAQLREQESRAAQAHSTEVARLSGRIAELEDQLHQSLLASATAVSSSSVAVMPILADSKLQTELLGLGATEVYDRIATSERALALEQSKCKELELMLKRIVSEVESKTLAIQTQKRDFSRIVESHELLSNRLNRLAVENVQLKESIGNLEKTAKAAVEDAQAQRQQHVDLSAQLQHLLKTRYEEKHQQSLTPQSASKARPTAMVEDEEAPSSASDVISTYLLTFDDIKELQTKNAQLVQVVRKLSTEQVR